MGLYGQTDYLPHRPSAVGGGVALADSPTWTGTHTWERSDAARNTVLRHTLRRLTTDGSHAQAGLGVGISYELEDDTSDTAAEAGRVDVVWSDPATASKDSSLAVSLQVANTLTEVARFGAGASLPDVDLAFSMGRVLMDSRGTDVAFWSHRDMTTTSNYAVRQSAAGATILNCASGQNVSLAHNGTIRVRADGTGLGVFAATPVAQSTGWAAITNPVVRKTFDTTTVTTQQLAEFVGTFSEYVKSLGFIAT